MEREKEGTSKRIIEIDGSYGSGGGQIIRTALAMSALTGKPFHITKIRAKRKNPGLAAQHLSSVNTVAQLCDAKVKGNFFGSEELWFEPKEIRVEKLKINIGTAGSISLVLQSLMPIMINITKALEIEITGGTDVGRAPSMDYTNKVLLKLLEKMGYNGQIQILKRGFFPKGGGKIIFRAEPMHLKHYDFNERGKLLRSGGISIASRHLEKARVVERQANEAKKFLELLGIPIELEKAYVDSISQGSAITLWIQFENSILGSCAIGKKAKPSEQVGKEAINSLLLEYKENAVVDFHAADQLLPYIAIAGGSLKTSKISEHAKTNAFVIEKFLPVCFKINEKMGEIKVIKEER